MVRKSLMKEMRFELSFVHDCGSNKQKPGRYASSLTKGIEHKPDSECNQSTLQLENKVSSKGRMQHNFFYMMTQPIEKH